MMNHIVRGVLKEDGEHVQVGDALLYCGAVVVAVVFAFEEKFVHFRDAMTKALVFAAYLSKYLWVREPALSAQAC
jgi:hypothetical protein